MANFFNLTLDTTGPQGVTFVIDGGVAYATSQVVTAAIATSDGVTTGYQMKVWGAVDTAYDVNVQTLEANSVWVAYATSKTIKLSAVDGSKTVNFKIRDDVLNEASSSDTITLDLTAPIATLSAGPDVIKISKIATRDTCTFSFTADTHIQAWKVKVVPLSSSPESAGTQIATTSGSTNTTGGALAAATAQQVTVKGTDLEAASAGDGAKVIKIFIQDDAGNWSV